MRKTLSFKTPAAVRFSTCLVHGRFVCTQFGTMYLFSFRNRFTQHIALGGYAQQKQKAHDQKNNDQKNDQKDRAAASTDTSNPAIDPKLYGAMKWRLIGHSAAGESSPSPASPASPNLITWARCPAASGKQTTARVSWDPLFDKQSVSPSAPLPFPNPIPM